MKYIRKLARQCLPTPRLWWYYHSLAQELVYSLKELIPTQYQKDNIETMVWLFLEAQGHPLPEHSKTKSPSALSRFLIINPWSTREMIRITRNHALQTALKILSSSAKGRKPFLQVIIDLTNARKARLLSV